MSRLIPTSGRTPLWLAVVFVAVAGIIWILDGIEEPDPYAASNYDWEMTHGGGEAADPVRR